MARNINNLFQDKSFPATLVPDEIISLREPSALAASSARSNEPDALASVFLSHAQVSVENIQDDDFPDSEMSGQDVLPMPDVPQHADIPYVSETEESDIEKLESITKGSQEILLSVETVLPPMIHPSKLIVDRQKLTIVHRTFWGSTDTVSVQMDDINNVEAFIGPLFGEIRIYSKYFINNVQNLAGLWRKDAVAIRRLVQGYMIAHNKGIDCSRIEKNQLLDLLTELGRGSR